MKIVTVSSIVMLSILVIGVMVFDRWHSYLQYRTDVRVGTINTLKIISKNKKRLINNSTNIKLPNSKNDDSNSSFWYVWKNLLLNDRIGLGVTGESYVMYVSPSLRICRIETPTLTRTKLEQNTKAFSCPSSIKSAKIRGSFEGLSENYNYQTTVAAIDYVFVNSKSYALVTEIRKTELISNMGAYIANELRSVAIAATSVIIAAFIAYKIHAYGQAEANKANSAIKSSSDAIYIIDGEVIQSANAAAMDMFGYTDMVGMYVVEITGQVWIDNIQLCVKRNSKFTEYTARKSDGTSFYVTISASEFKDGSNILTMVTVRDASELVRQRKDIERLNRELEVLIEITAS